MRRVRLVLLAAAVLATARCDNAGSGRVLSIDAFGVVSGLVYLDRNGNRLPDGADTVLSGVRVYLIANGTQDTTVSVVSDSNGGFRAGSVPIGVYVVSVDTTTVGDSVDVVQLSATQVTVRPADSLNLTAAISYPLLSVRAARQLGVGRKVFVEGLVLVPRFTFGDSTGHLADSSLAIRLTRMRTVPFVTFNDSLRVLATRSTRDGQPTLDDAILLPLGITAGATPTIVTAETARDANGGALDAALVFLDSVTIVATQTQPGTGQTPPPTTDVLLTVDRTPGDTAGRLEVLLDAHAGFTGTAVLPFGVDSVITVTGVLVPNPNAPSRWVLKPRFPQDAVVH